MTRPRRFGAFGTRIRPSVWWRFWIFPIRRLIWKRAKIRMRYSYGACLSISKVHTSCVVHAEGAQGFYEQFGFKPSGRTQDDEIEMVLEPI